MIHMPDCPIVNGQCKKHECLFFQPFSSKEKVSYACIFLQEWIKKAQKDYTAFTPEQQTHVAQVFGAFNLKL